MRMLLRRFKGALVNAAFWGIVWFAIGLGIDLAIRLPAGEIFQGGTLYLRPTLRSALETGAMGAMVGGAFSVFIAVNFHKKRVEDLSAWRFALGGGLVTAMVLLGADLLSNPGMVDRVLAQPLDLYMDLAIGMLAAAGVGAGTAFGAIKLAQHRAGDDLLEARHEPLVIERG